MWGTQQERAFHDLNGGKQEEYHHLENSKSSDIDSSVRFQNGGSLEVAGSSPGEVNHYDQVLGMSHLVTVP